MEWIPLSSFRQYITPLEWEAKWSFHTYNTYNKSYIFNTLPPPFNTTPTPSCPTPPHHSWWLVIKIKQLHNFALLFHGLKINRMPLHLYQYIKQLIWTSLPFFLLEIASILTCYLLYVFRINIFHLQNPPFHDLEAEIYEVSLCLPHFIYRVCIGFHSISVCTGYHLSRQKTTWTQSIYFKLKRLGVPPPTNHIDTSTNDLCIITIWIHKIKHFLY